MATANQAVSDGSELSTQAQASLDEILSTVDSLSDPIAEVTKMVGLVKTLSVEVQSAVNTVAEATEQNAAAAQQMAASSDSVSDAVIEVSAVAEEQTAMTEELTSQAIELAELASDMDSMIRKFKLDTTASVLKKAA